MAEISTPKLELAERFVNATGSHIFLTGKAGTGKTTFLRKLINTTHKKLLVVAPTGVAAIQAKGVTVHSQFLLPFGTFIPDDQVKLSAGQTNFYTPRDLVVRRPLNSKRKQVLNSIKLLVIDEVSMLRADVLDAIDVRLKSARRSKQPFGGVQLLMIGDLHQLPPIVRPEEWQQMQHYYASGHFFESRALKQAGYTYIELDKIFRQQDEVFIGLLNKLRNDRCVPADLELLNKYYTAGAPRREGTITLTTHNNQADRINRDELNRLTTKTYTYTASVSGDFPEQMYPLPKKLELRVGAQVMFVKNDIDKRFYNGKLAKVVELDKEKVVVEYKDEFLGNTKLEVPLHDWANKKYSVDDKKELVEEEIGKFQHLPLRLAWAITVHKSQGLTFDRAIIDVERAFAPGQVYVALSRLRSLDGLQLNRPIPLSAISSDRKITHLAAENEGVDLDGKLAQKQQEYIKQLIDDTFNFGKIVQYFHYQERKSGSDMVFEDEEMRTAMEVLRGHFEKEATTTAKFRRQLHHLLGSNEQQQLAERLQKGSDYYYKFLLDRLKELRIHQLEVGKLSRVKAYLNSLDELEQLLAEKLETVQKSASLCHSIVTNAEIAISKQLDAIRHRHRQEINEEVAEKVGASTKIVSSKTGRTKQKKVIGQTYQITYGLLGEGKTPAQVADERGLAESTIYGHVARGIGEGVLQLKDYMAEPVRKAIVAGFGGTADKPLAEVHAALNEQYDFQQLRMVQSHLQREESN